jgi:hypothetical protein
MRFAPPPGFRGLAEERKISKPWKRLIDRGYAEYGSLMLEAAAPKDVSKAGRRRMMTMLDKARGRNVFHLTNKGMGALSKALSGKNRGAAPRSPARPRSGHK